ncbi:class I SAM-dependent methyltransferase [Synoicihabitans lomoniglobus]|uniref:Class I SAM-dependent methyltransferase n=1 Tax=Synoicihabitans lomoniglobus TaxID=2909285 RepID=A0AAE9ZYB2_9BACT|nr:class I SAM-dependent methyltransferase [Opitutaceae bacterium LMO-M01]WED63418.1 class I SAM-dependent methyltransferase [Opitutaceae bacterium LMO-M01]
MARNDHFSAFAATYAQFRPTYPDALFGWLARQSDAHGHAWDCATGNGQAAHQLTPHFERVTATDVGAAMIAHAPPHPRITFAVGSAEHPPIADHDVNLITVAQALHWFDLPAFWQTCQRVLQPHGVLAYWGYLLPQITPAVDALVIAYHDDAVGPYWPDDRGPLLTHYANVCPPAERIPTPTFAMNATWTVDQLIGMLDSWSATHRARAATGSDPLAPFGARLREAWGAEATRPVSWPITVHAFRF